MPTPERFLITRFDTFTRPWMTEEWVLTHAAALIRAFQALERGHCYAALADPTGIQCLTEAEYDAEKEKLWRQSEFPSALTSEIEELADCVMDKVREREAAKVAHLRQPTDN